MYLIIIRDVLTTLGEDTTHKADWIKFHFMVGAFESFDFVFSLHLMFVFWDTQMNYLSIFKEDVKILFMQSNLLVWQKTECNN